MSLSLDDRILGEKVHYYCSSSEEDNDGGEYDDKDGDEEDNKSSIKDAAAWSNSYERPPESNGITTNVRNLVLFNVNKLQIHKILFLLAFT